ncbi:MAG: toxin HipA [Bacteroidetes bacterium 24-39-8]|jgi:serine/threonine-protein kinase HipA|nr:MAG: toxin HipA [Bacteroidetes bacterium 24-39-8]OZA66754.1 MAG: toxin HipA [Sphingobacteriia bacterium 39-39-8]HQR93979.1 type II toxin-antitoxin system HipA family toxin [Sediminibacterium sp.]HQS53751.1 type II toxin-antitoxin system HipA family toxin [Sediminibacterium sp.]
MIDAAYIHLWGKRVGAIAWDAATHLGSFEFEQSFLSQNLDLAPLKMPISQARGRVYSFPELSQSNTFKGLPGLLSDVLPDKYGNTLINAWLAQQGRPANSLNPVEMLCFIGKRGMGALEFEPAEPQAGAASTKIEMNHLVHIAQEIMLGRKEFQTNLSADEQKALAQILKIGTSAGGARAKALIAFNAQTGEVRSGQAEAPKGFTHWLIKFDGVVDTQLSLGDGPLGTSNGYGRVEMAYYKMALASGIDMMESRLLEEHGRAHFMTKRFDRIPDQGKLHVQSFCGMQHVDFTEISAYSYEQLFQTMRMLRLSYPEAEQLFRRMVFNVLARNCDDHTKNFAFTMNQSGQWHLSPAYDICHAYRPGSPWVSRQSLSVNGQRDQISHQDLLAVAKSMNIKKPAQIVDEVKTQVSRWEYYAEEQQVPTPLLKAIQSTLLV